MPPSRRTTTSTMRKAPAPPPPRRAATATKLPPPPPPSSKALPAAVQIAVEKAVATGVAKVEPSSSGKVVVKTPVATVINPTVEVLPKDPVIHKPVVTVMDTAKPPPPPPRAAGRPPAPPSVNAGRDYSAEISLLRSEVTKLKAEVQAARTEAREARQAAQSVGAAHASLERRLEQLGGALNQLNEAAAAKFDEGETARKKLEATVKMLTATLTQVSSRAVVRKTPLFDFLKPKPKAPTVQGIAVRQPVVERDDDEDEDDEDVGLN